MKPIATGMSCVLLTIVWFVSPGQDTRPIIQTGDIHLYQTIIHGSNNTLVRE